MLPRVPGTTHQLDVLSIHHLRGLHGIFQFHSQQHYLDYGYNIIYYDPDNFAYRQLFHKSRTKGMTASSKGNDADLFPHHSWIPSKYMCSDIKAFPSVSLQKWLAQIGVLVQASLRTRFPFSIAPKIRFMILQRGMSLFPFFLHKRNVSALVGSSSLIQTSSILLLSISLHLPLDQVSVFLLTCHDTLP